MTNTLKVLEGMSGDISRAARNEKPVFTAGQLYDMRQKANWEAEAYAILLYPDKLKKERLAYIRQESDRLYYAMTHP